MRNKNHDSSQLRPALRNKNHDSSQPRPACEKKIMTRPSPGRPCEIKIMTRQAPAGLRKRNHDSFLAGLGLGWAGESFKDSSFKASQPRPALRNKNHDSSQSGQALRKKNHDSSRPRTALRNKNHESSGPGRLLRRKIMTCPLAVGQGAILTSHDFYLAKNHDVMIFRERPGALLWRVGNTVVPRGSVILEGRNYSCSSRLRDAGWSEA